MTENLNMALELMGQGMAGIFAVLGIIALLVVAVQRLDRKGKSGNSLYTQHSQSATTSARAVGLTRCSTNRESSSSTRWALVVTPGTLASWPPSSQMRTP